MKKRFLSLLTAGVLLLGLLPAALAVSAVPPVEEAAQALAALDIMVGDQTGDLHLDRSVTRAEFTRMAVAASPQRKSVGKTASVSPYPDVPRTHWAAPFVQAAVQGGYLSGYLDGTFRPENRIALSEGVTIVLRLLGYQPADFTGAYPAGQMAIYRNLELDRGIPLGQNDPMTRKDALYLFYNLLTTKNKTGQFHLNVLEPTLGLVRPDGTLDRVALVNSAMEGPVLGREVLSHDLSRTRIYRDGREASVRDLKPLDVVYWSQPLRTLWAYTRQATGRLDQVAPSASHPTAVTVAGRTYPIETSEAAYALSDLGSFRVGDQVLLLLGRDGGVAAVSEPVRAGKTQVGVVLSEQKSTYTDAHGNQYTDRSLTVCTTDGEQWTYPSGNKDLKPGELVKLVRENGVTLLPLARRTVSGTLGEGELTFAQDAELLEVYNESSIHTVTPDRLSGVRVKASDVLYYSVNAKGELDRLILRDVTGDGDAYGILTDANVADQGLQIFANYVVDVGGRPVPLSFVGVSFSVDEGPCGIKGPIQAPESVYALHGLTLQYVSGQTALAKGGQSWPMAENVPVYQLRDGSWYLTSLTSLPEGCALTGYYDRIPERGGLIRVIVAK